MSNIRGCKKITSHSTAIPAAIPVIRAAEHSPLVTKIVLGVITTKTGVNCGDNRIKIDELPAGLKLIIRGRTSLQEIIVFTSPVDRMAVKQLLTQVFNNT